MPETIIGSNQFTVHHSDTGYAVCKYALSDGRQCTVVGQLPDMKYVNLKITGEWVTDKRYGRQFKASAYEIVPPDTEKGIVAYFASLRCGIGRTWAKRIYAKFGNKTWYVLENTPDRLLELEKFGNERLKRLKEAMSETKTTRDVMSLFSNAGVTEVTAKKAAIIAKNFGSNAVDKIRSNPYNLCKIKGLGFTTVEKIAFKFGGKPNDYLRIQACILHLLEGIEVRGHSCISENMLLKRLYTVLNAGFASEAVSKVECKSELKRMIANKKCFSEESIAKNGSSHILIYSFDSHSAECGIVRNIKRVANAVHMPIDYEKLNDELSAYDKKNEFDLAKTQKKAIITSLTNHISVITGGPGTGKTTITKAILHLHKQLCKDSMPVLLAPTARAARRLSESTGCDASTIHSAIGLISAEDGNVYTMVDSIDANLVIIDEASMLDQYVAYRLFEVIPDGATVIMIGDPNQLPAVGAGNVLLDIINSKVIPTTELEVIFRQGKDSPIIYNSKAVLEGNTKLDYSKGFYFKESSTVKSVLWDTCKFYLSCVEKFGIDNICLLTPLRKDGDLLSVASFNKQLQHIINPPLKDDKLVMESHGIQFRKGDKVMQMRNTPDAKNGDIGYIKDIIYRTDAKGTFSTVCVIDFEGNEVFYDREHMGNVELAYASTVHKSQGSEYKTVIVVVSDTHKLALKRNLIYTAITRATENVAIIGQQNALEYAIRNNETDMRNTHLEERLFCAFNYKNTERVGGDMDENSEQDKQLSLI